MHTVNIRCCIYWGWIVCFLSLLLRVVGDGINYAFTELFVPISDETHLSNALLGMLGILPDGLSMITAPLSTRLHSCFSVRLLVVAGVVLTSASLCLSVVISNVVVLLSVSGILSGFGLMLVHQPPFFLLDRYFPYTHPRHAFATGIPACAFPLATLIFNPVTYELLALLGWRLTNCALAGLLLVVGLTTAITFRAPRQDEVEEQMTSGTTIDKQIQSGTEDDQLSESNSTAATQQDTDVTSPVDQLVPKRTKVLMTCLWLVVSILNSIGYYTPFVILVKQMDVLGIPQWKASRAMILMGSCELVSRALASYFGDYIKGKILYMYLIFSLALCALNIGGSFAYTFPPLLTFAGVLGLLGGPVMAAVYACSAEVMDGQYVPELFTLFRSGLGVGMLLGPTIAGAIYDATDSFVMVYQVFAVLFFLTAALYAIIIAINRFRPTCCFPTSPMHQQASTSFNYGTHDRNVLHPEKANDATELLE